MRWAIALVAIWPALAQAADEPSLLLPSKEKTLRLQLAIRAEGQTPEVAHGVFLEKLFLFFDRDNNGSLNAEEANRVFALPGSDGRGIAMDFKKLDTDGDGKGSLTEFQAYYRNAGFTPIVAIFSPSGAELTRANAILFNRLDRDGDGKLSRAELERAPNLLQMFDADEDEVITIAELLAGAGDPVKTSDNAKTVSWSVEPMKQPPDGLLSINSGKFELNNAVGRAIEKNAEEIRFSGGTLRVNAFGNDPAARLNASREFYLAPFKSALGSKLTLDKQTINDDSSLAFLDPLVPYADRNGDDKLSLAELEGFLDLIEAGVRSQIVVRIADEGAGLLAVLDENRNGRLDLRELDRAVRLLPKGRESLAREEIPRRITVAIEHGSPGKTFGPMLVVGKSNVVVSPKKAAPAGPKWFQAMDRNGDGMLSPREFLGPPDLFEKLDADHDGFISVEEARQR
jgi:Ca2+-binding EF-hand superfamily protein